MTIYGTYVRAVCWLEVTGYPIPMLVSLDKGLDTQHTDAIVIVIQRFGALRLRMCRIVSIRGQGVTPVGTCKGKNGRSSGKSGCEDRQVMQAILVTIP